MRPLLYIVLLLNAVTGWALPPEVERAQEINAAIYQRFAYEASPWTVKRPGQTIIDGAGDCADLSSLLIEVLEAEGITAVMGVIIIRAFTSDHAVVVMGDLPEWRVTDFSQIRNLWILDPTTGQVYSSVFMRSHLVVFTVDHVWLLDNWSK